MGFIACISTKRQLRSASSTSPTARRIEALNPAPTAVCTVRRSPMMQMPTSASAINSALGVRRNHGATRVVAGNVRDTRVTFTGSLAMRAAISSERYSAMRASTASWASACFIAQPP
jgi:hypothetical protein